MSDERISLKEVRAWIAQNDANPKMTPAVTMLALVEAVEAAEIVRNADNPAIVTDARAHQDLLDAMDTLYEKLARFCDYGTDDR